jgi:hypothetical protein
LQLHLLGQLATADYLRQSTTQFTEALTLLLMSANVSTAVTVTGNTLNTLKIVCKQNKISVLSGERNVDLMISVMIPQQNKVNTIFHLGY